MKCYPFAITILAVCTSNGAIVYAECAGIGPASIPIKFTEAQKICAADGVGDVPSPVLREPPVLRDLPRWTAVRYEATGRARLTPRRGWSVSLAAQPTTLAVASLPAPIVEVSQRYRIDPLLLDAIVTQESGYRTDAVSAKGALGLMQVMPSTARILGVSEPRQMLSDPRFALATGAAYLKTLQYRFGNNIPLVLAAYNAGPGAVLRFGGIPHFAETRGYVTAILQRYQTARLYQLPGLPR